MKNCKLRLIFSTLVAAITVQVQAQTPQQPQDTNTVTISGAESQIELPIAMSRIRVDDYYNYLGAYTLSNGETLVLLRRGNRMYGEVGNEGRHEIVATASDTFVAIDRQLKMRIDLKDNGDVSGELYYVTAHPNIAKTGTNEKQVVMLAFR